MALYPHCKITGLEPDSSKKIAGICIPFAASKPDSIHIIPTIRKDAIRLLLLQPFIGLGRLI
jgi:hypothetical protein